MRPIIFVLLLFSATLGAQNPARHALDPLSAAEITRTVAILRAANHLTPQSRFGTITVQPQPKNAPATRGARVVGHDWSRNQGFLAVVDLGRWSVTSWTVVDSEPPMRLLTIRRAEEIAHADPRWVAALRSRGIDTARVSVLVSLPERAKLPREGTDRVAPAFVWLRDGVPDGYVVNGLTMSVNLTQGRLQSFGDNGARVAITDSSATRALAAPREALRPLEIRQTGGSSAAIRGNEVTWDRWTFRVGVDPRLGLEVHDVSFSDAGRRRPVLYSGSISEIIAPYGDPRFSTWYPRDEGDYGMGIYSMSSAVENDVPANARFLSSTMHDHLGRPIVVPKAIAIYERDGGILWRHANVSRRARQLVVSGHATIDNYDYQFNWIFGQDGAIESEVVLSGIMNVNNVGRQRDSAHVEGHSVGGHLVAPGINAPNHQHFFSYRLDLDVDGSANTIYEVDTEAPSRGSANPEGESFVMTERRLVSELKAIRDVSFAANRSWRVANTRTKNTLGQFTGYTLVPGAATPVFALAGSAPRRTGGFTEHQLWATPYAPEELYAGGEFQNLGRDWEGLSTYTKADRSLIETDVVLWYTLGITHIPRPEDWPYMPAHRGSFRLLPTSFFARNPTLDVPR
jgi:primary-amine oxidase